ncbi:MFS transporter [Subtercola boreus]|uniref:MFS transporter n=1 Tax=Subtercola boreus TaxID=120213 RepID=UPI00117154F3|nr:MFS transporter [Subtercola boreus]TQL52842.1 putative MFS family arabinose efflux permease [Subtercola boreus]
MTNAVKTPVATESAPFPYVALFVLATAVFMSVTAEMMPTGLLPEMSAELGVTESQIGLLVTLFAVAVVITAVPLSAMTRRFSRHTVIVGVLLAVAATSTFSALAPSYGLLAFARVLGGTAHGLFWAVVGVYAAHLVPRHQIARAVAITTGGGTLAFVLGVPAATVVGHAFGWRVPFLAIAVLSLCASLLIAKRLPRMPAPGPRVKPAPDARAEPSSETGVKLSRLKRLDPTVPGVAVICVIIGILMVGHYSLYTYVTPFLIGQLGVPIGNVGGMLFVYGVAGALGLLIAGFVFGGRPTFGVGIALVVTGASVLVLSLWASNPWLSIPAFALWGIALGVIPTLMQARVLHVASPAITDTAAAFYSTAFNIGIGGGALVGGLLLSGFGLESLPLFYLLLLFVSGALLWISVIVSHRRHAATLA